MSTLMGRSSCLIHLSRWGILFGDRVAIVISFTLPIKSAEIVILFDVLPNIFFTSDGWVVSFLTVAIDKHKLDGI